MYAVNLSILISDGIASQTVLIRLDYDILVYLFIDVSVREGK
jgi:hypothetical protein